VLTDAPVAGRLGPDPGLDLGRGHRRQTPRFRVLAPCETEATSSWTADGNVRRLFWSGGWFAGRTANGRWPEGEREKWLTL